MIPDPTMVNTKMSYCWNYLFFKSDSVVKITGFSIALLHNKCFKLVISVLGDFRKVIYSIVFL